MSIPATSWVWSLEDLPNATVKLVLMKHADNAHDDGTHTWQSIEKIAKYALCSERTAQRANAWLIEHGYLREGDQSVIPSHYDPRRKPIAYELAMSEAKRAEWEALAAAGGMGKREAAKAAGAKGGRRSAQVRRGDNLTPQDLASTAAETRGDNLTPQEEADPDGSRGDNQGGQGVTNPSFRGDTGVTQTTQETTQGTTQVPSDSLRSSDGRDADEPMFDTETQEKPVSGANHGQTKAGAQKADSGGVDLTGRERETGQDADGQVLRGKKRDALANAITQAWWDWIAEKGHSKPAQSFIACRQVVKTALGNGVPPRSIRLGLARITEEGRAVSGGSLQIAMGTGREAGMRRGSYSDVGTWGETDPEAAQKAAEELDIDEFFSRGKAVGE